MEKTLVWPRAFINWRAGTCGLIHRCFRFISGRRARCRILLLRLRRTPPASKYSPHPLSLRYPLATYGDTHYFNQKRNLSLSKEMFSTLFKRLRFLFLRVNNYPVFLYNLYFYLNYVKGFIDSPIIYNSFVSIAKQKKNCISQIFRDISWYIENSIYVFIYVSRA